ncbi:MAG: [protein-PII] uridylyltransferase [Rhodospirillaceae bacterium]|nr:[protein-PII] uridylyltransferase [Rhodospirillaceae bacterium]
MDQISNRRGIVNRRQLAAAVADIPSDLPEKDQRARLLSLLKRSLEEGRKELEHRLESGTAGPQITAGHAYLIDQIIGVLFEFAVTRVYPVSNPTAADRIALVAVGGYGRGEMAPFSDVDLLFLIPYKQTPRGDQIVEYVLYMLWDLGLQVGQSVRSVDECLSRAKRDITIRTNLLEMRFLWGEQSLFSELERRFKRELIAGSGPEFLTAKLGERDERHGRMGDSRYVVEPNIKEGKGGLRDLHTLLWITRYLYDAESIDDLVAEGVLTPSERRKLMKARRFLLTVRCHLHYVAGRAEERLTFDVQPKIARRMHYTDHAGATRVERFMKHYYLIAKTVGELTRVFCADLEAKHKRWATAWLPRLGLGQRMVEGFPVESGRISIEGPTAFVDDPVRLIQLFHVAQKRDLDIHPEALRQIGQDLRLVDDIREDPRANALFMEILTSRKDPETSLRRMNEAGVLGRFIPDFGRVIAQTQHDMYHVYTVDEHTIFAIGILSRIEQGKIGDEVPLATDIVHKVQSRKALYLAVFLHDIAKGRGGDHSELGAKVARRLGPRLGLTAEETETVSWLVLHHLLFSGTAFKRDVDDPKTVTDFVEVVQSPERLRQLLVLTVADIRAVGPKVWNGWKGQLLRDLYHQAEDLMMGGDLAAGRNRRVAMAIDNLKAHLPDWPDDEIDAYVARHYPPYWIAFSAETHARHARLLRQADREKRPLTLDTQVDRFRSVTEITLYAPDFYGLFAGVAGAMAVCGANIVDAKIFTTTDGMALDVFWIQDAAGGAFDRPDKLAKLATAIDQTLAREMKPAEVLAGQRRLPSRTEVFTVEPRVFIDNAASATRTVIEVNGRDRPGLLFDLTRTLRELSLSIASARITTFGERAVDVFYVKDMFGLKIHNQTRLDEIRRQLLAILDPSTGADDSEEAEVHRIPEAAE